MDPEAFREFCLKKTGVTEESPFGPEHLVYKVGRQDVRAARL
jgi:predicted DNA-binding protein (MmcQ/YjbR family)